MKMKNVLSPSLKYILLSFMIMFLPGCGEDEMCVETTWYADVDNDGLGDPDKTVLACDKPSGYVSNGNDDNDTPGPTDQRHTTQIASINIGENYPLQIFLPADYEVKDLPVLYMLDGKTYYEDLIIWQSEIGLEAIVVSIGDHLFQGNVDLRRRDFLPGFSYEGETGGHIDFYDFLTEEVIPYIDENYENDHSSRTIIGHHAAGLFTNFSLVYETPDSQPFSGFISVNAEILNATILIDLAKNLNFSQDARDIKFLQSQVTATTKAAWFNNVLIEQAYPWLEMEIFTIEDENTDAFNPSVVEPSIKAGLDFIYD